MWDKIQIKQFTIILFILVLGGFNTNSVGQVTDRERPKEWDSLVFGARFKDLFLPMPEGIQVTSPKWGADSVMNRYQDNGIEDRVNSYWGGNIVKDKTDKYHLYVCGWPESSEKGHMAWPGSIVYHTVSDRPHGPYRIVDTIGKGHNPEIFQTKDGTYVIYVIDGSYQSQSLDGPWIYKKLSFDRRDRPIIEGLSNLTFAKRGDNSQLMICRGGGVWVSETGTSTYFQIANKSVYPDVDGEFEDPVVWKDDVQYHLIVNDWLGRIAFYLRSPDGIYWVVDPGEAYTPDIAVHRDGEKEGWFKYERMKVFQDEFGRAIQANFAVIDTIKWDDKPNDKYSSKNIAIPLRKGVRMVYLNTGLPQNEQEEIKILLKKEKGFNPLKDIDLESLRFGSSVEVNYGRGSKIIRVEKAEDGVVLVFSGKDHHLTRAEFAPKILGKRKDGELLFGYCRVPWGEYEKAVLTTRKPKIMQERNIAQIEIENFGVISSEKTNIQLFQLLGEKKIMVGEQVLEEIMPYGKTTVYFPIQDSISEKLEVSIGGKTISIF